MLQYVKETRKAVRQALAALEKSGWYTGNPNKPGIWCCGSCSWGNIPEEAENAVFYHEQTEDNFKRWGRVWLYHRGDTSALVDALHQQSLLVNWNGKESNAVQVMGMERHLDYGQNNWEDA
jgi:hypothetical protein